jgi:hypothetical protein
MNTSSAPPELRIASVRPRAGALEIVDQAEPSNTSSPAAVSAYNPFLPSTEPMATEPMAMSTARFVAPPSRYQLLPASRVVNTPSAVAAKERVRLKRRILSKRTGKLDGSACVHSLASVLQNAPFSVPARNFTSASASVAIVSDSTSGSGVLLAFAQVLPASSER